MKWERHVELPSLVGILVPNFAETVSTNNSTSKSQLVSRLCNVMTVSCKSIHIFLYLLLEAPTRHGGGPHVAPPIDRCDM